MKQSLYHRVPGVLHIKLAAGVHSGAGVVVFDGSRREGGQHIQRGHGFGALLDPVQLSGHLAADAVENLPLHFNGAVVSPQHPVFQLLELWGDVPFSAG